MTTARNRKTRPDYRRRIQALEEQNQQLAEQVKALTRQVQDLTTQRDFAQRNTLAKYLEEMSMGPLTPPDKRQYGGIRPG